MAGRLIPTALAAAALSILWAATALPVRAQSDTIPRVAAKAAPREIAAFLRRRNNCNRLSGEDGDDPGRVAEAVRSRFWMKCSTLDDDERRLRARFADKPSVLEALDQGGDVEEGTN